MALVVALVSIEGKTKIAPGSVFDADETALKHLESTNAVKAASKEDVALAKARGLFIEKAAAEKAAAEKAAAEKAAAEKKSETKGGAGKKPDDDL